MDVSQTALEFLKEQEGLRLKKYLCSGGYPTIGYGHRIINGESWETITAEQAEELLRSDVSRVAENIGRKIKVPLTQDQFDALVCFAFNIGTGAFARSTALKRVNAGDHANVPSEIRRWVKAGRPKQVNEGLVKRRAAESAMYAGENHD